jgi:hypothetical protein
VPELLVPELLVPELLVPELLVPELSAMILRTRETIDFGVARSHSPFRVLLWQLQARVRRKLLIS